MTQIYRIRVSPDYKVSSKVVDGITIKKRWLVTSKDVSRFVDFSGVEVEKYCHEVSNFIPVHPTQKQPSKVNEKRTPKDMSVAELKTFLQTKGEYPAKIKSMTRASLLEIATKYTAKE